MDRRSSGGILGGFGIIGDGYVQLILPDIGPCWNPLGALGPTARTLRSANGTGIGVRTLYSANGTGIGVSGSSNCLVSFMGIQTEFPILICDLATGTDAIIGTDVLGTVLPHTLDTKNGLLFTEGGASLQLHRRDSALSGQVFTVGHGSIPPYSEAVLHCSVQTTGGRQMPVAYWSA